MSTQSYIVAKIGNTYKVVYCHLDGCPEHHCLILTAFYSDKDIVHGLMEKGHIRSLEKNFGDLSFYGETSMVMNSLQDVERVFLQSNCVYLYLFSNEKWFYTKNQLPLKWFSCCFKVPFS